MYLLESETLRLSTPVRVGLKVYRNYILEWNELRRWNWGIFIIEQIPYTVISSELWSGLLREKESLMRRMQDMEAEMSALENEAGDYKELQKVRFSISPCF